MFNDSEAENNDSSNSQSYDNSNLEKDDEDMELEENNNNLKKSLKNSKRSKENKYLALFTKENLFPLRYPLVKKHSRKYSFKSSSSSEEELDKSFKNNVDKNNYKSLSEFDKSKVRSEIEIFESNINALKNDFIILEKYEKSIFKDTSIDIMYIINLTKSTKEFFSQLKHSIKKIIENIKENIPGCKTRLSYLGYKSQNKETNNFEILNFSEDIENYISRIKSFLEFSIGGNSLKLEDILNKVFEVNWKATAKYIVLIYEEKEEWNEENSNLNIIEDLLKKIKNMNITFYCTLINSHKNKLLFDFMKKVYDDEKQFNIEEFENFFEKLYFFIIQSASDLIRNNKKFDFISILENCRKDSLGKIMNKYSQKICSKNIDKISEEILINEIKNMNIDGEDINLLNFINRIKYLNIDNNKISLSNNNKDFIDIQFGGKDFKENENKEMDFKIYGLTYNKNKKNSFNSFTEPLIIEQKFNTKIIINYYSFENIDSNKIYLIFTDNILGRNEKGIFHKRIEYKYIDDIKLLIKKYCLNDLICEQIADFFNVQMNNVSFIKFKKTILYIREEKDKERFKYIIADYTIPFPKGFDKEPESQLLQAFSHFSYQITLGELIIMNMKYNNEKKCITHYDIFYSKDDGYKQILNYFSNHICNSICKYYNLIHPRKKANEYELKYNFFSRKYNLNYNLCKICSLKTGKNNIYCSLCEREKLKTLRKIKCEDCHKLFNCFIYEYTSNLLNIPTKCKKCRKQIFESE